MPSSSGVYQLRQGIPNDAAAVTKSDSTVVDFYGLYVGGAGDVVVTTGAGNDVTLTAVPAGSIIALHVTKIKAATTATNIVGFKA